MSIARWLSVLAVAVVSGCIGYAPKAYVNGTLPRGKDPVLYVTAARQKDGIVRALRAAGFQIADQPGEGTYLLRATIGVDQGFSACGTFNNVHYTIRVDGNDIVEVDAKGWSGTCEPNVLDAVSRELRRRVVELTEEGRS